jgi:hypothetical protein
MKIYEFEGVRTFRRDVRSIRLARAIQAAMKGLDEALLAKVVRALVWPGDDEVSPVARYQAVRRAMPFEIDGVVYNVVADFPLRQFLKPGAAVRFAPRTQNVVIRPGRLEDYAPQSEPPKRDAISVKLKELAQWTNVFALREEARKYMDARLEVIESRLSIVEKDLENVKKAIDISATTE